MRDTGSTPGLLPLLVTATVSSLLLTAHARETRAPSPTVLVLGAAQYNGAPSPAFKRRLDHALKLYRGGNVRRVVVTGGVGEGDRFSEGAVGVAYLQKRGVPKSVLFAETKSRNTLENVTNARPFIRGPVTLVTDEVHATRALALARAVGLDANVSSIPIVSTGEAAERYRRREKLALAAYTLLGIIDDEAGR